MAVVKGGHAASGPPPDPSALRRNRSGDAAGWTTLPECRAGEAPAWPLTAPTVREHELWVELWSRPQAVMWERLGQDYEVALMVRYLVRAEGRAPTGDVIRAVRQYQESLGLTTQGMLRNRWRIAEADPADVPAEAPAADRPRRKSARDRLKVVSDGESG